MEMCSCTSGSGGLVVGSPASVDKESIVLFHGFCKGGKDVGVTLNILSLSSISVGKVICGLDGLFCVRMY